MSVAGISTLRTVRRPDIQDIRIKEGESMMRSMMKITIHWVFLAGLLSVQGSLSLLRAQATARISGTVSDTSSAVIPEALIQAKNVETGILRSAVSDPEGRFRFPDLAI